MQDSMAGRGLINKIVTMTKQARTMPRTLIHGAIAGTVLKKKMYLTV
jgi:hypothetical protein